MKPKYKIGENVFDKVDKLVMRITCIHIYGFGNLYDGNTIQGIDLRSIHENDMKKLKASKK